MKNAETLFPPRTNLDPWIRGHSQVTAKHLQQVVTAVQPFVKGMPHGRQFNGIPVEKGLAGAEFRLSAVFDEYLECYRILENDLIDDEITKIARPRDMRKSFYNGLTDAGGWTWTYNSSGQRTGTDGLGHTEIQLVGPPYYPDGALVTVLPAVFCELPIVIDVENNITADWLEVGPRTWRQKFEEPAP